MQEFYASKAERQEFLKQKRAAERAERAAAAKSSLAQHGQASPAHGGTVVTPTGVAAARAPGAAPSAIPYNRAAMPGWPDAAGNTFWVGPPGQPQAHLHPSALQQRPQGHVGHHAPTHGMEQAVPAGPSGRGQSYVSLQQLQQQQQLGQAPGGAAGRAIPLGQAHVGSSRLEGLTGAPLVSPPNRTQGSFAAAGYVYGSAPPGASARPQASGGPTGYPGQALSLQQVQAQQYAYAQHQDQVRKQQLLLQQHQQQQRERIQALQNSQKAQAMQNPQKAQAMRPAAQQGSPQPNAPAHLVPSSNAGHAARAGPPAHATQAAARQAQQAQPPMSLSQVTALANQEVVRAAAPAAAPSGGTSVSAAHGPPGDRPQRPPPPQTPQAASSGQVTGEREGAPREQRKVLPVLQPDPPKPRDCIPGLDPQQRAPRHKRPYRPALRTVVKARVPGLPIAGKPHQASLRTPSLPVAGVPYTRILPSLQVIPPFLQCL